MRPGKLRASRARTTTGSLAGDQAGAEAQAVVDQVVPAAARVDEAQVVQVEEDPAGAAPAISTMPREKGVLVVRTRRLSAIGDRSSATFITAT
jgi:hypothetical protein